MKLRTASRLIVIVLVVLIGGIIALRNLWSGHAAAITPPATLTAGTALGSGPAPAFSLQDQTGATISLAALKGHPVVLTFLDAACASGCSTTAQDLNRTAQALGTQAGNIAWLAITVNPTNTPGDVTTCMTQNQVRVTLHVLLGTQAQLAPLWKAYYVEVIPPTTPGGAVQHTGVTYLIDSHGRERELLDQSYDPTAAAHDLSLLLAER